MAKTEKSETTDETSVENAPELAQHPALQGSPEIEVEQRGADNTGESDLRWRKTFVLQAGTFESDLDAVNEKNALVALNEAIQNGLHPTGEARFDGQDAHSDGVSVSLHYSVPCEPAVIDHDPQNTVTPRKVLDEKLDGSTDNA